MELGILTQVITNVESEVLWLYSLPKNTWPQTSILFNERNIIKIRNVWESIKYSTSVIIFMN